MQPKYFVGLVPTSAGVVCAVIAIAAASEPFVVPPPFAFAFDRDATVVVLERPLEETAADGDEIVVHAEEVTS